MNTLVAPTPEAGSKPAQILDAAGKLFLENGYGAVSMDAVAKMANVSKATLYAHFGSKDELFRAMVACVSKGQTLVAICEEAKRLEVADGLRLIARHFADLVMSPRAMAGYRVVVGEAHRFPELAQAFYEAGPAKTMEQIVGYMEEVDRKGQLAIPDPQLAAEQLVGLVKSHTHLRYMLCLADRPSEQELTRIIDGAVNLFIKGYAA
ncbi:TetR/AcrR family transcriptional regulator [Azospirillum canadense]|uniref:TetR/AcrR family transcriptional regulator n=1 Tax=Azospirillum canadense TaxID=403962 RepID=UPI002226A5EA|nr:TetR/AcrR family transcriptional regulator [Azospirillum canadense]MCW2243540.1 AcrR family transcriptional regulator [Azospirillum canadense]